MEDSLIFRILKFGMENPFFKSKDLKEHLGVDWQQDYFNSIVAPASNQKVNTIFFQFTEYRNVLDGSCKRVSFGYSPNVQVERRLGEVYQLVPSAAATYIEMVELQESRKAATQANERAQEAKKLAWMSIAVAIVLGVLSIMIQQLTVQDVKVVNKVSVLEESGAGGIITKDRKSEKNHQKSGEERVINLPVGKQDTIKAAQ